MLVTAAGPIAPVIMEGQLFIGCYIGAGDELTCTEAESQAGSPTCSNAHYMPCHNILRTLKRVLDHSECGHRQSMAHICVAEGVIAPF